MNIGSNHPASRSHYPAAAVMSGLPQLTGADTYSVESDGNPIVLTSGPVESNIPLVMTLEFNTWHTQYNPS